MRLLETKIVNSSDEPVSAGDFWKWQKTNSNTLGLKLLGFAKPEIEIYPLEESLAFRVFIKTAIGRIRIFYELLHQDYVIHENYWIPLDMTYL